MLDTDFSKEIRVVFKKGQIMEDHQAPFAIIVQVIKGSIDFGVIGEVQQMNTGDIISLKPQIVHNLIANRRKYCKIIFVKIRYFKKSKKRINYEN